MKMLIGLRSKVRPITVEGDEENIIKLRQKILSLKNVFIDLSNVKGEDEGTRTEFMVRCSDIDFFIINPLESQIAIPQTQATGFGPQVGRG